MTGSRRTGWNVLPRLTTRGSMPSATPTSTNTTWSSAWIDQIVDARNQLRVPAAAEATLEHRELHPLAVALHQLEHAPPPLGVGDVVDDDVEMLHGLISW